jgi:dolichol-phosphate mannosyltransferase
MTVTVIVPTFNEEENIGILIDQIRKYNYEIIVCDDGSTDNTREIVKEKKVTLVDRHRCKVKGLTAAVLDSFDYVETDKAIIMDADFQHPTKKLPELERKLDSFDLVVGSRKSIPEWSISRRIISIGANFLARFRLFIVNKDFKDPMSGFFGIKTKLMNKIIKKHKKDFVGTGFKILFEAVKFAPRKIKIGYVKYVFGKRTRGKSKISKKHFVSLLKSLR